MLGSILDIFRLRQYFDVIVRTKELLGSLGEDVAFADAARRAIVRLPFDPPLGEAADPFAPLERRPLSALPNHRVGIIASGGSGALASLVGVARAFEEGGISPAVITVCSGSAMFGFPIAAGVPAGEVGAFMASLDPREYVDVDWKELLLLGPKLARGFAGILKGESIEATFRRLVGDRRLGDLPIPAYAPIWNVEHNRLEHLGPRTHPDMPVARAIRMAISLPLFVEPAELDGGWWCDGGIVDIFPVTPVIDLEPPCDVVIGINGFFPSGFRGEEQTAWREKPASILYEASQVRTCQLAALARENLARLRRHTTVHMLEPVPYQAVRGLGFYRQFIETKDWPSFMRAGLVSGRRALRAADAELAAGAPAPVG